MKFDLTPLIATLATTAFSTDVDAWNSGMPTYGVILRASPSCNGPCTQDSPFSRMLREQENIFDREFFNEGKPFFDRDFPKRGRKMIERLDRELSGSRGMMKRSGRNVQYQITNNDKEIKLAIYVPGVNIDDVVIDFEEETRILTVGGSRESTVESYTFNSNFSQSFYLDSTIEVDKISANLQDGVLIVTAPKEIKKLEARRIPINLVTSASKDENNAVAVEKENNVQADDTEEDDVTNLSVGEKI